MVKNRLLFRPFNIYGGGGALANRYFLPLFPAFWFMASRPCRPRRIVAVCLMAAPFLWPLWTDPSGYPKRSNHTYRYVSEFANRLLPFETTQSHLKPAGRSAVVHGGLWVKFLSPTLREKKDRTALLLDRGSRGQMLVGSNRPLKSLYLQILEDPAERLEVVRGATTSDETGNARGRRIHLDLDGPRARHPMWWTWNPYYIYQLTLESPSAEEGRLTFILRVASPDGGGKR